MPKYKIRAEGLWSDEEVIYAETMDEALENYCPDIDTTYWETTDYKIEEVEEG